MNDDQNNRRGFGSKERSQVHKGTRLKPAVIHEIVREEGEEELLRSNKALWWSGLAAGLSMGFSMVAKGLLGHYLPAEPWAHPIVSVGYTAGFIIVILARQQLFTENTITALLPVIKGHRGARWDSMLRLWGIVLAANTVGALLFAIMVQSGALYYGIPTQVFIDTGLEVLTYPVDVMFVKGIAGGWLIAALVWVLPASEGAKFWVIFFFTWLIGLGSYTHIVAGMVEVFMPWLAGQADLGAVVGRFMLPTLAGNVVGGSAIFALISYAQVREEVEDSGSDGRG